MPNYKCFRCSEVISNLQVIYKPIIVSISLSQKQHFKSKSPLIPCQHSYQYHRYPNCECLAGKYPAFSVRPGKHPYCGQGFRKVIGLRQLKYMFNLLQFLNPVR